MKKVTSLLAVILVFAFQTSLLFAGAPLPERRVVNDGEVVVVAATNTLALNGTMLVLRGGRVTVEPGATLRLIGVGALELAAGARLELGDRASVELIDYGQAKSRATLRLDDGATLALAGRNEVFGQGQVILGTATVETSDAPFTLRGSAGHRLRISMTGAPRIDGPGGLNVAAADLTYAPGAKCLLTDARASLELDEVRVSGRVTADAVPTAIGFFAAELARVTIARSTFEGLSAGLLLSGGREASPTATYTVTESVFRDCLSGLSIHGGGTLTVRETTFGQSRPRKGAAALRVDGLWSLTLADVAYDGYAETAAGTHGSVVQCAGPTLVTVLEGGRTMRPGNLQNRYAMVRPARMPIK